MNASEVCLETSSLGEKALDIPSFPSYLRGKLKTKKLSRYLKDFFYAKKLILNWMILNCIEDVPSVLQASVTGSAMGNEMFSQNRGKPCCWEGELPPRNYCNPVFSSKVFIGGIPWDTTEPALHEVLVCIFFIHCTEMYRGRYTCSRLHW